MKAPMNVKLYPRGYYECPKCGTGVEVLVRVLDKPSCSKHGSMQMKPKPKNFGKEES